MYLHIMSYITTKLYEILLRGFSGSNAIALTNCIFSIFNFGQISQKFKKGVSPRKKLNQNFLWICTSTYMYYVLLNYKIYKILLSGLRGVALTRKTELTDWLTDGSKTLYPPQLVGLGTITWPLLVCHIDLNQSFALWNHKFHV